MAKGYVLVNKLAGDDGTEELIGKLKGMLPYELTTVDVKSISDYREFFAGIPADSTIVLTGGDGTLNRFINNTDGIKIPNEILYYPTGTGNDFAADFGKTKGCEPFPVKEYFKNLPVVTVNGKTYRFLNGVGYGIDGYCCEVGDQLKAAGTQKINYTSIAIKGLLFHFHPSAAKVTVDGVTHSYKKAWLAPAMNGKHYGGGMMPTPAQERGSGLISTMVYHDCGKLKALIIFPSIFNGGHVAHKDCVDVFSGKEITVEFDRPCALQVDGETILNVSSYTAHV